MSDHDDTQTDTEDAAVSLAESFDVDPDPFDVRLADVYGLPAVVEKLRETFVPALTAPEPPIRAPSLVLHGPEGAGQHRLARAVAGELGAHDFGCLAVTPESLSEARGGHRPRGGCTLARLIEELRDQTPATLLVSDLNRLSLRADGEFHEAIEEVRASNDRVAVLSTISQDGRFSPTTASEYFSFADFRIEVPLPDGDRSLRVLEDTIEELVADTPIRVTADVDAALADTSRFDVADLQRLARRTVLVTQNRDPDRPVVTTEALTEAVAQLEAEQSDDTQPGPSRSSVTAECTPSVPDVSFDDVGGLDDVITRLRELVTFPQEYADLYDETTLSPAHGVLLHGPPGTGKTLLAKALANETSRSFFAVEGAAVKSKWFGQSEQRVRELFAAAREAAPSIVFFDEFDAIAASRDTATHSTTQSIVNTLLAELDGVTGEDDVLIVAATNRPDTIDPAICRPGRIGEAIQVPPPDAAGVREIFRIHTAGIPTSEAVTPAWFADTAPGGVTGAEIAAIVERALHRALSDGASQPSSPTVRRSHVRFALASERNSEPESLQGYH